jgi:hypothetical protein
LYYAMWRQQIGERRWTEGLKTQVSGLKEASGLKVVAAH